MQRNVQHNHQQKEQYLERSPINLCYITTLDQLKAASNTWLKHRQLSTFLGKDAVEAGMSNHTPPSSLSASPIFSSPSWRFNWHHTTFLHQVSFPWIELPTVPHNHWFILENMWKPWVSFTSHRLCIFVYSGRTLLTLSITQGTGRSSSAS